MLASQGVYGADRNWRLSRLLLFLVSAECNFGKIVWTPVTSETTTKTPRYYLRDRGLG